MFSNGDNRSELPGPYWERNVKTVPSNGVAARCGLTYAVKFTFTVFRAQDGSQSSTVFFEQEYLA